MSTSSNEAWDVDEDPKVDSIAVRHPRLQPLYAALSNKALSCAIGAFPLPHSDLILYYGKEGPNASARRIDFGTHAEDDVKRLAEYCDPASFGRGSENVHDESYRKAGKLDKGDFAVTFDPVACGLIDRVRDNLLEGHGSNKTLRIEPYKLNVYGASISSGCGACPDGCA